MRLLAAALAMLALAAGAHPPPAAAATATPVLDLASPERPLPPAGAVARPLRLAVEPGGIAAVRLPDHRPVPGARPQLWLGDEPAELWPVGDGWLALVPVSYWTAPGPLPLRFAWTVGNDVVMETGVTLTVVPKDFPVDNLRVSASLASRRSEERLQADSVRTQAARSRTLPRPLWDGPFAMPLAGRRTSEFGQVRMVNGRPTGRHSGLDLAAPEGTPVRAAASGRVVLADWLYVTGGTVIIDHGLGVFTSYAHLSRIAVAEGQRVRQGDVVGDVGATGFATGPHLHWSAWIRHTPVNPEDLLRPPLADLLLDLAAQPPAGQQSQRPVPARPQ